MTPSPSPERQGRKRRKIETLDLARLREVVDYDPDTGLFRWRKRLGPTCKFDAPAGTIKVDGYRRLGIDGKSYPAHQLAWLHFYGTPPAGGIDHANGIKDDNRIENLRIATPSENSRNARRPANKTGFRGVKKFHRRYHALIRHHGERLFLGTFETAEEAYQAYCQKARELHGEFARLS